MSRPLPTEFDAADDTYYAPTRPIINGQHGTIKGEHDIASQCHYLLGHARTPIVRTIFNADQSAGAGLQPYVVGAATEGLVKAAWFVPCLSGPWVNWEIVALVENTSVAHAATVRVKRASDGTYVDINVPYTSGQWTRVTGTLAIDTARSYDSLQLHPINGTTGEVRVHDIEIRYAPLGSVAASKFTLGGVTFRPFDDSEVAADAPLSVAFRNRLYANLEFIRRAHTDSVVGWSDSALYRVAAYQYTSVGYTVAARIPFMAPAHKSYLRWGLYGFVTSGTGYVRLSTLRSRAAGAVDYEKQLAVGWTSPHTSNLIKYDDTNMGALTCTPGESDEIMIELKGTNATLMGIVAWAVDP